MNRQAGRWAAEGFTLLELLVVIAIIATLAGMIIFLPSGQRRDASVSAAAEELAATLRTARSLAMERQIVCGVVFNIQNAPGTSGRVLNNHSGGHWYRIIGAWEENTQEAGNTSKTLAMPPVPGFIGKARSVAAFLDQVQASWIGDEHGLAPGRVRFLALSDQDTGSAVDHSTGWNRFPDTYPRPWFGWWDAASGRLHPWGGYDPTIVDRAGRPCSGFYYQGNDSAIIGCTNPVDRFTTYVDDYPEYLSTRIFAAGAARPLVNGDWLDYVITFYPDGTAREGFDSQVMKARFKSYHKRGTSGYNAGGAGFGDLGDLCAEPGSWAPDYQSSLTSYFNHTGGWSITLGPDADVDTDQFGTARDALDSIWPAYRIHVSRTGLVTVTRMSRLVPPGTTFDTTITDWQDSTQTRTYYQRNIATNADGSLRATPLSDFLAPEILASRQWWLASP